MKMILEERAAAAAGLTEGDKKALDFIVANKKNACFLSSYEIAARIGTSPSTVVRLSKKLGYGNFAAFRRALHSFQSVRHESLLRVFGSRQKDAPAVRKTKKTLPTDAPRRNILLVVSGAKRNTDFLSTPVSRQRAQGNHYTEEKENSIDRERVTGFP